MPVRFEGSSEYTNNFLWHENDKNKNNSAVNHVAGLPSTRLGQVNEPPIPHRRAVEGVRHSLPQGDGDEYILLGDQGKFAKSVPYPLKHFKSFKPQIRVDNPGVNDDAKRTHDKEPSASDRSPPPAPRPADPPRKHTVKGASYQNGHAMRPRKPLQETLHRSPPKPAIKSASAPVTKKPPVVPPSAAEKPARPPTAIEMPAQPQDRRDEFVQTDLGKGLADSGQHAKDDYALKYKAGIASRPKGPKRLSEYQMQYKWHQGLNTSPLLAAEQVVYKSNPVLSGTKDLVQKESVYKQEFRPWKYVPVPTKSRDASPPRKIARSQSLESLTPDKLRPTDAERMIPPDNRRLIKESLNPLRPFFPHGKTRAYQSEYQKNFQPFTQFEYDNGAWKGAAHPHTDTSKSADNAVKPAAGVTRATTVAASVPATSSVAATAPTASEKNWFAEVLELRRRAAEYKQRARGTHFSREHLAQLYARQAELWDAVSTSSTLSALSLEDAKKSPPKVNSSSERPPAGIRTAWDVPPPKSNKDALPSQESSTSTETDRSGSSRSASSTRVKQVQTDEGSPPSGSSSSEGRVPTPKMRTKPPRGPIPRHHLDRTTPSVGGALLSSPPKQQLFEDGGSPRNVPSAEPVPQKHSRSNPVSRSAGMLYGMPTRDTHLLVDEEAPVDLPLDTHYTRSPPQQLDRAYSAAVQHMRPHGKDSVARRLEYQEKHPELSIPTTIMEGGTSTYHNELGDENDDVLSQSARSVASSSSLASEVLNRARNRRDNFWGRPQ